MYLGVFHQCLKNILSWTNGETEWVPLLEGEIFGTCPLNTRKYNLVTAERVTFCRSSQSCFSCSSYFQNKNCDVYVQRQQTEISCWAVIIPDMSFQQLMRQKTIKNLVCNYVVQTSTPLQLFWWGQVIFQKIQHSFWFFTCAVCQISPRFLNSKKGVDVRTTPFLQSIMRYSPADLWAPELRWVYMLSQSEPAAIYAVNRHWRWQIIHLQPWQQGWRQERRHRLFLTVNCHLSVEL